MHKVDEASPLFGKSRDDLIVEGARINVTISGLDETLYDIVHARREYDATQLMFGYHFVDILQERDERVRTVDFRRFHEVRPDGSAESSRP
jgi:inward rectifier potassium channel